MIPCPKVPVFVYNGMESYPVKKAINDCVEGRMSASLRGFAVGESGDLARRDSSPSPAVIGGTLCWLELSRYEDHLKLLDASVSPGNARVMAEATLAEDGCAVPCWVYTHATC
jgi:hypothetical protein